MRFVSRFALMGLTFLPIAPANAQALAAPATLPTGDAAEVRTRLTAWSGAIAQSDQSELSAPVVRVHLSSPFGLREDPINGTARRHAGIDLPGLAGTPVHAAADGVVAYAGWAGGYGNLVEIAHSDGIQTRYAHMEHVYVTAGMLVRRGAIVGLIGSTGRSTGNHLHFEVRVNGRATDPLASMNNVVRHAASSGRVAEHWAGYAADVSDRLPAAQIR